MILVTVGAQMPFDRLVAAVDAWAALNPDVEVLAQIGEGAREPTRLRWVRFLSPEEFRRHVAEAQAVVAHAGMGTILTALEHGKPVVVMPRRGDLRETRNDHQVATAERFRGLGLVHVALDDGELRSILDRVADLPGREPIRRSASPELLATLRAFVDSGAPPGTPERGAGAP